MAAFFTLEQDTKATPQVAESLSVLLNRVARQGWRQHPDLPLSHWVPALKGLSSHWQEGNTLPPAVHLRPSHLLVGECKSEAWGGCCLHHRGPLKGVYHSHIRSSISTPCLVWNERVGGPSVLAREEEPTLLDGSKTCRHCCLVLSVLQVVLPTYPLDTCPTGLPKVSLSRRQVGQVPDLS